ncbi:unnamed protein product [Bemisia tabaci]|uniref:SKA complex subunit 1 n=1 Tax=Bemisia tabaci TaxID=7038 RepID=A0A9P0F4X5_BEMTA|nr:unnamed protein product [Bemisia tabaci]
MEKKLTSLLVQLDSLMSSATIIESLVPATDVNLGESIVVEKLQQLVNKVNQVNAQINYLHECFNSYDQWMEREKELLAKLENLTARLDHLESYLPAQCFQTVAANLPEQTPPDSHTTNGYHSGTHNGTSSTATLMANSEPKTVIKKPVEYPHIRHLTQEELDEVPSYIRNRLQLDRIRAFVDNFNAVMKKKYALMRLPRNKVPKTEIPLYTAWKVQDNKETKGHSFLTKADLDTFGSAKLSKGDFTILQILRHCKRLRESKLNKESYYILID